mgnify:CR=1 FL=1
MIAIERRNGILEKLQEDKKLLSENSASYIKYLKRRFEEIWNVWKKKVYVQRVMAGLCSMRITMWRCRSTSERKAMQQENRKLQS